MSGRTVCRRPQLTRLGKMLSQSSPRPSASVLLISRDSVVMITVANSGGYCWAGCKLGAVGVENLTCLEKAGSRCLQGG